MKDLQTLVSHPGVQGAQKLILVSDRPILMVRDGEQKPMGQPLGTQQLGGLLKASIPPESMAQLQWGREFQLQLPVGSALLPMNVAMHADKTFQIEIQLQPEPAKAAPAPTPTSASPSTSPVAPSPTHPSPSVEASGPVAFDEELERQVRILTEGENLALIYRHGGNSGTLEAVAQNLGFSPRLTLQTEAANEALKYGEFPLVILDLGAQFRQDPVYLKLCDMLMDARRQKFVVLIAPGLANDTLTAFSLSVNLILNPAEQAHFAEAIEKGIDLWRNYVNVYHHFLQAEGRL